MRGSVNRLEAQWKAWPSTGRGVTESPSLLLLRTRYVVTSTVNLSSPNHAELSLQIPAGRDGARVVETPNSPTRVTSGGLSRAGMASLLTNSAQPPWLSLVASAMTLGAPDPRGSVSQPADQVHEAREEEGAAVREPTLASPASQRGTH